MRILLILLALLIAGCTSSADSFEELSVNGLIPAWESGVESYFDLSLIIRGGSDYYTCELDSNAELPNGVSVGGYNGCEISGLITLNPGTSKLITPPFLMIVSDDFGNTLSVPVSLTIVENAPLVYGNYFECVAGESCNKKLVETSGGTTPYTYRLGSMAYGVMPPGTAVGVDGYLTGAPNQEGVYDFEVCVIDAENIVSCAYPSINVVSSESELGQNLLYSSNEDSGETFTLVLNSAGSSNGLLYIDDYTNIAECDEFSGCIKELPSGSYVSAHATFGANTYFVEWRGVECDYETTDNFLNNDSTCHFELTSDVTITAVLNKRPTANIASVTCVFDRYNSNYPDSKIWGYYVFSVSGTASTGSTGSVLSLDLDADDSSISLNCGSWTNDVVYDKLVCVREATDPDTTSFNYMITDFSPSGYLLEWSAVAQIIEHDLDWIIATAVSGAACPYE